MRYAPTSAGDRKDLAELKADPWMVAALKMNPDYNSWGPDEDYMGSGGGGWNSPMRIESWAGRPDLDDLNEVVNFYFEIRRDQRARKGRLALIVWLLHPRKGASRGVEIKRIKESEMPDVLRWLASAAERNAQRFAAVVAASVRP